MAILNSILGIIFIFLVAFLLSNNKKKINWRTVIIGFLIQFGFAVIALKWSVGKYVLGKVALGVQSVINYAKWIFTGILWCITIVGIPVGKQCFKMAKLQFAPFGKEVTTVSDSGTSLFLNILWLIFGGFELCVANLLSALVLCITIVGIPFAAQSLKLAKLSLMPFGKEVR